MYSKFGFPLQEVGSQIPNSLIPSEYHIVKNPGVMGLEFQEEYVYVLFTLCRPCNVRVISFIHINLNTVQLLCSSFTLGTINRYFPLFWCMVIYCNVCQTKENTKLYSHHSVDKL